MIDVKESRLAKVQRRCGRHDLALGALNCAIDRAPSQMERRMEEMLPLMSS